MCVLCCTMFLSLSVSGSEMWTLLGGCICHHFWVFPSGILAAVYTFLKVTETLYAGVCYYFRFIIALPMGRLTKRKCYRPPKRASWTLELSLPQINLFKVVLKSLKLLMESRTSLPSPRILRVPCRWAFPIWNNSTRDAYHVTLSRAFEKPIGSSLTLTCQQQLTNLWDSLWDSRCHSGGIPACIRTLKMT